MSQKKKRCIPDFGVYQTLVYTRLSRPLWCIPDFGVYPPANATLVYSPLSMEGVHRFETKLPLSQQLVVYTKVRYTPESGSKAFTIHQSEGIHQKHVRTNALFVYTKVRYTPDGDRKKNWTHTLLSRRAGSLVLVWPGGWVGFSRACFAHVSGIGCARCWAQV